MLAAAHRLHRPSDFSEVVRRGQRSGRSLLVVHLLLAAGEAGVDDSPVPESAFAPARVGFVVSRAVGGSVVRHRVTRRLRAQVAPRLTTLPAGSRTVIRALPASAGATSDALGADLDHALARVLRRSGVGAR